MSLIWTPSRTHRIADYDDEADLETTILQVQKELFGEKRIYVDVKKRIGVKGEKQNVPDGYLLDLSGRVPRLYVVENELARHHPIDHVARQLLEFALAFETTPRIVQTILLNSIHAQPEVKSQCESYIASNGFRNIDHLLGELVHKEFSALVIIDEIPDRLENILATKLRFTVEVIELKRYTNTVIEREHIYAFRPFLEELNRPASSSSVSVQRPLSQDIEEIDTLVVAAREEGFQNTFIGENRWHEVRIGGVLRSRIKYIAAYRTAPISAITHVAR